MKKTITRGRDTSLYKLYRLLQPHRVGLLRRFGLKTGIRFARESKSGIPEIFLLMVSGILEILLVEFDPGLLNPECSSRISGMPLTIGIGDPRRGIQNPGLSWIPLHGATRRCSHPRYPAKLEFIDDLGSVISNEDGFEIREISIR